MEFNYRNGRPAVKKPLTHAPGYSITCSIVGQALSGQDYGEKVE